jgi:hypothetical protein
MQRNPNASHLEVIASDHPNSSADNSVPQSHVSNKVEVFGGIGGQLESAGKDE